MEIGIPKETRRKESRVSLVPRDVEKLIRAGHSVRVQEGAGTASGFGASAYEQVGATVSKDLHTCDLVVGVKAPPLSRLRRGAIIMAYLHVEKGQNADLLRRLTEGRFLSYAFEEIRDAKGDRLVNLGFEAGIVGIVEGLRILGSMLGETRGLNPFRHLSPVAEYGSKERIFAAAAELGLVDDINVVIMGMGRVSRGVQDVLRRANISPTILCRKKTAHIERYLADADILVNSVDWYPGEPHILTRDSLGLLKSTALVLDISCDKNGAIETCTPTTWDNPTYRIDGIAHFCVSNLPSAIPGDSSVHLSNMILPHVMKVAGGEQLPTGMITRDGEFVYQAEGGDSESDPMSFLSSIR